MATQKSIITLEEPAHLHVGDVGGVFITGRTGSGKTTLQALAITQFAGLSPDAQKTNQNTSSLPNEQPETTPGAGENPKQNSDDTVPSLDAVGGEALAGSGFEDEKPDPAFHSGK